jgi:hypothetical protein
LVGNNEGTQVNIMNMKTASKLAALALAMHATGAMAQAWNNGGPAVVVANQGGSVMSDTLQAQDFSFATASNISAVTFWSLEALPADYLGSITYSILSNVAGSPGATVISTGSVTPTRTAAGTVLGFTQFKNDFALSVLNVPAGTYWLSLHNGSVAATAFNDFYWSWADPNATNTPTNRGREFSLAPLGVAWTTNDQEHAFNIVASVVPEPATWALALAGLALVATRRRTAAS